MKRRTIKSFEPARDVLPMLDRAAKDGIKLTHIVNAGARLWLTKKGYGSKKNLVQQ